MYTPSVHYVSEAGLPKELSAVLPADPLAQIEIAHQIIHYAYQQRVTQLEGEAQQLRESLAQKQNTIKTMERRVTTLEIEMQEVQQKNQACMDDQHKLLAEKNALIDTVKRLNREVAKLESFRRNLRQQLQDEDDLVVGPSANASLHMDLASDSGVGDTMTHLSGVHLSPSASRVRMSTPLRSSVLQDSGPPLNTPKVPPASSVRGGSSPRVDGKEFFRQARGRLSYEQFSQFLQSIKELNAGRQTREDTLRRARELFGLANNDLYELFEGLLNRHAST